MSALGARLWDGGLRARVESLQWAVALGVIRAGGTAIIEWGTWARDDERRVEDPLMRRADLEAMRDFVQGQRHDESECHACDTVLVVEEVALATVTKPFSHPRRS